MLLSVMRLQIGYELSRKALLQFKATLVLGCLVFVGQFGDCSRLVDVEIGLETFENVDFDFFVGVILFEFVDEELKVADVLNDLFDEGGEFAFVVLVVMLLLDELDELVEALDVFQESLLLLLLPHQPA